MMNNRQLDFLDLISIVGFVVGLANYDENLDQSSLQTTLDGALQEVHRHLKEQDLKIDEILERVKPDV